LVAPALDSTPKEVVEFWRERDVHRGSLCAQTRLLRKPARQAWNMNLQRTSRPPKFKCDLHYSPRILPVDCDHLTVWQEFFLSDCNV
jgi:hypothetical protein